MEHLKPQPANSFPLTTVGFLERAATVYGDCLSIVYNDITYTWSQTYRRCLQLASSLASLGINRGDVVSIIAPNVPAMYEVHFAVPFTGAILNCINTRLDARTVSITLQHAESKLLFVDCESRNLVLEALSLFPPQAKPPSLVLITDDSVVKSLQTVDSDFCSTYESLVEKGDPRFKWVRPVNEWDPMVLNYTSGTTSAPKGVVLSHRGIFVITTNTLINWSVPKQPVYLWVVPIFHGNGWSLTWGMAAVGGTNICLRKFDTAVVYDSIRKHGVTHLCAAPIILNMISNSPHSIPLEKPVHILTAAAPPPPSVLHRTESLGFIVTHGYGLVEVGGVVVTCEWKPQWNRLPATERARMKSRQGVRTVGFTEVDVLDPTTRRSVAHDGSSLGEIVFRGGSVMLGYLKDPEATRKCMTSDGWLITGDVGVIHPDGYLEIKDRSKDIIISGGENISSVEVESILYTNPSVNEAAIVARPDEHWGETPCAFVSLKPGLPRNPTEKELIEYCREKLPRYMVPKTVVFMEELPKISTGKIRKPELREIAKRMGKTRVSRM